MEITTILLLAAALALGFAAAWLASRRQMENVMGEKIALSTRLDMVQQELDSLRDELEFAKSERTQFHERVVVAETQRNNLKEELEKTQEKLRTEFKNTATSIFEDFSNKFTVQSEEKIGHILNPLREKLAEFQKSIGDSL